MPPLCGLTLREGQAHRKPTVRYLIGLLEAGKIPFRRVGRHRRIRFEDLLDYKRQDDLDRRVAADKLAELTEELDL